MKDLLLRLSRVVTASLLAAALALSGQAQASAESPTSLDRAKQLVTERSAGDIRAAAARSAVHDAGTADNDIVATDLRFDSNTIHASVTTREIPRIDDSNWMIVYLSFNGSESIDAMLGVASYEGIPTTFAVDSAFFECPVTSRIEANTLTISANATCFGKPGVISYIAVYGDLVSAENDDYTGLDIVPLNGFSEPVAEAGGYWLLGQDGGVFSFGDARFYGSTGNLRLNEPVVGMSAMPDTNGYRFVASDGGIFSYGSAAFKGSMGGKPLNKPVVGMATTKSGNGYWMVASDGGIFAFGDAPFFGSTGSMKLNQPIVGMSPTASGNGYWMVAADGGIFAFGDANFYGSAGSTRLSAPIVKMAMTTNGLGYSLLTADGNVLSYGNAGNFGNAVYEIYGPAVTLSQDHMGYVIADSEGGVHAFGNTFNFGDLMALGVTPNKPIVDMARVLRN